MSDTEVISLRDTQNQFVQDGLDELGNDVSPDNDALQRYDQAIRNGDIAFINYFINTFGHYDVPILNEDPLLMLKGSHEALAFLDEQEYIVLPDIVRGIIYDDPAHIYPRELSINLINEIISRGAIDVFLQYQNEIIDTIMTVCTIDRNICDSIMNTIRSSITNEDSIDIIQILLMIPSIRDTYTLFISRE